MNDHYRLCFVDGPWAYFADCEPTEVRGDDWNDSPHDCNAGTPYEQDHDIVTVAFDGDLWPVGVGTFGGLVKEKYGWLSADQINRLEAPWLVALDYGTPTMIRLGIWAGVSLDEFRQLVGLAGGTVYEKSPALKP